MGTKRRKFYILVRDIAIFRFMERFSGENRYGRTTTSFRHISPKALAVTHKTKFYESLLTLIENRPGNNAPFLGFWFPVAGKN